MLRFLDSVLQFPAFDSRLEYAHFDSKVGEHVVQLLDTLANRDLFGSTNGTEKHRLRLLNYIQQFTRRMPISYSISSPKGGLQLRSWSVVNDESRSVEQQHYWASFESSAEFYSFERDPSVVHFTGNCFLRVPSKFAPAVVRAFCLRNSTLLPDLDGYSPILNTELEEQGMANLANRPSEEPMVQQMARSEDEGLFHRRKLASTRKHSNFSPFSNQGKILIGLRPTEVSFLPSNFNYTCAIYDHNGNFYNLISLQFSYMFSYSP